MPKKETGKTRLDQLLVERGLVESRAKAQALIMAGKVFSDTKRLDKPGHRFFHDTNIEIKGRDHPWVSRGGVKLAHGLDHFAIDPQGMVCLDVGASTGGFTDVLLSRGADKVYAVDVGHGQLDWKIRQNDRVVVLEKTNSRNLDRDIIGEPIDLVVSDVSFISLELALPAALTLAAPGAYLIALIKPQFEAGRGEVGKGGIVRETKIHVSVCQRIERWLAAIDGWKVLGLCESPITGTEGNIEFLIGARFEG